MRGACALRACVRALAGMGGGFWCRALLDKGGGRKEEEGVCFF